MTEDDGTARWAAEEAAGLIGLAWYRAHVNEGQDQAEVGHLMLSLAAAARGHITASQWKALGQAEDDDG
jgi:hypothetical protein